MILHEITTYSEFSSLREEWNALLKQSNTDSIFFRHEWFDCWWKSHAGNSGDGLQLFILLVKNNEGKIKGIFPFLRSHATYRSISVNKIGYLESGLTPYIDFILTDDKEKIIDKVLDHIFLHNQWDIFTLNNFPTNSEVYSFLLERLRSRKIQFGIQPSLNNPIIKTTGNWENFLASRPVKFRKSLRNKLNKINKKNEVSIEKYSAPEQIISFALPHVFDIAKKSWKAREKHAFVDSKAYASFFTLFTEKAAPRHWINIWLLKYKDKYIAHEYHLKYNKRIYPIGADFDERYRNLSPGSLLEYFILKSLFEDHEIEAYDTCAQDYKYLKNWTEYFCPHVNIEIFSRNTLSRVLYIFEYVVFPPLRKTRATLILKKYLEKHGLWIYK